MDNEIDPKDFEPLHLKGENFTTVSFGFLHSILHPEKRDFLCCVCYQPTSEPVYNIETELATVSECFTSIAVLGDVVKSFVPDYVADTEYQSVCSTCCASLLQMYTIISKRRINLCVIESFMNSLAECIDNKIVKKNEKVKIHFQDLVPKLKKRNKMRKQNSHRTSISLTMAEKNNLQCDECGNTYDQESKLMKHKQNHVLKDCYICLKTLKGLSNYRNHLKIHAGTKEKRKFPLRFKCEQCPYRSMSRFALEGHVNKVHLKIRPYICHVCSASFVSKGNLQEHVKTHNPKSLMCELCGLKSNSKKILKKHMWTHAKDTGFQCELCSKMFPTTSKLNAHLKSKHSNARETCEICLKSFSCRTALNRHLRYAHKTNKKYLLEDVKNVIKSEITEV